MFELARRNTPVDGLRVLLRPLPVPPGWGVLARASVVLELLEVLGVGVAVVAGTEPEDRLGYGCPVGDVLLDEQSGAGLYAAFKNGLSCDVDCLLDAGIDELLLKRLPGGTEGLLLLL